AIQPAYPLAVDEPTFASQQHVNAPITVTHTRFGDLFDPLHQNGLPGSFATVVVVNLPPTLDRFRLENRASLGDGLAGIAGHSMKHCWHLVADRAVRSHLVVVSTPSLAFSACLVEAEEPIGVQALSPKLAVQAFDECVVGRLAGPAEVESDAAHE